MLHHGSDAYWLSRQQDMLPSNRVNGLVNATSVTDRSEGQRLIARTVRAGARAGAIIGAASVGAGRKLAEIFSVRRTSVP